MTRAELTGLHESLDDARRVVKSLKNHTRTATELLTDLEKRLERYHPELPSKTRAQEAEHGNGTREPVRV